MSKRTNPNATLDVEGATVSGSEKDGWRVTFDKTNNPYKVDKDGNISVAGEITISEEKDIAMVAYYYNTMYNPDYPDNMRIGVLSNDANGDKKADTNEELYAYMTEGEFDIPIDFFSEDIPEGDIVGTVINLDGELINITLKTEDNKIWKCTSEVENKFDNEKEEIPYVYISFRPEAQYDEDEYMTYGDERYKDSSEYHFLYIESGNAIPIRELTILGKTIEFLQNCQAQIMVADIVNEKIEPMYNDIQKVSKITVNFSDGNKKEYTKASKEIRDAKDYTSGAFYYSSQDVPVLYENGYFIINMQYNAFQNPITSILVEEDGKIVKYNVSDLTMIGHAWVAD